MEWNSPTADKSHGLSSRVARTSRTVATEVVNMSWVRGGTLLRVLPKARPQHSSPIDGGEKGRGVYPFLYRVHIHISTDAYLSADVKEYRDDP